MWLACFLGSLCVLGLLHGAYGLAVMLRVLDPLLYAPMAGPREAWSIVLLNSVNLAVACSTFYSFCGNAADGGDLGAGQGGDWKAAVCHRWLQPVSVGGHSAFTRWVIYYSASSSAPGDAPTPPAAAVNASSASAAYLSSAQARPGRVCLLPSSSSSSGVMLLCCASLCAALTPHAALPPMPSPRPAPGSRASTPCCCSRRRRRLPTWWLPRSRCGSRCC